MSNIRTLTNIPLILPTHPPYEDEPPIGRAILQSLHEIEFELMRRHGPDYSMTDFMFKSRDLFGKSMGLLAGLIVVAAPEIGAHAVIDGVKQLLSRLYEEADR